MVESSSKAHWGMGLFVRLAQIAVLVAVGTPLALWATSEFLQPRAPRRPRGAMSAGGERLTSEQFFPMQVVPRMPVVQGFEVLSAEAARGRIADEELVLAVEINGQARAWPLNVMTGPEREVFNDQLGGRAIAATW